jgi:hypothetical protein
LNQSTRSSSGDQLSNEGVEGGERCIGRATSDRGGGRCRRRRSTQKPSTAAAAAAAAARIAD